MDKGESPRTPGRFLTYVAGGLASLVVVGALLALLMALSKSPINPDLFQALAWPSFFLLPLLQGLVAAYFWKNIRPGRLELALVTLVLTIATLAGAHLCLGEGWVCLYIVSPLIWGIVFAGALLGRVFFGSGSRLSFQVLPLVALLVAVEPLTRRDEQSVVTDEIVIRAPASKVWPCVTSFPAIPAAPRFWLFRLGLPYPVATTSDGDFVGAGRCCIFSGDAVFKETVAALEPEKELTFDIDEIPSDPELLGHLTPHRGQFSLRDNGDGTTTLTGRTWYTVHVRPVWYFDWWVHHIFRAVHLRVMEDVKRRAES